MTEIKWAQSADHLPLEAMKPNPRNPKKHTKAQLAHIRESILRFGFLDPIGVWGEEHIVVEGHGRLEALRQMAAAQEIRLPDEGVPCIRLDHLSKRDRDAYMLEHNQATMETGWDDDVLDELLGDLSQDGLDMGAFGFDVPGEEMEDGKYTLDVHIPQYEVRGETPNFADMLDSGKAGALTVALSQGGDYIGGLKGKYYGKMLTRKAMNTFFCRTDRPIGFIGTINEDVNTYTTYGSRGERIFSVTQAAIVQKETQQNAGGMTGVYLDNGTYLKSFYTVMTMPGCVSIAMMGSSHRRIHHNVSWVNCVPMILNEKYRKT